MGDLVVDLSTMQAVSRGVLQAAGDFRPEHALSGADSGTFGSATVESAFVLSASALDAMIRSLGDDADTLGGYVTTAAEAVLRADADLARRVR
ncbi:hypothetical protein EDF28_0224 [Curtobacterium sp. PhB137]|uniref:hypothetical protein n=1 Tax=unclassified Curtobacterium TaxID=257496 RepID=UPI000F500ACD|nr:hypothetical protein [Curtobacterium sp. PhB137]RPE84292.1 hypothetical protein EDF28_0224 [Curtobacterium sp. PhB137]